MDKVGIIGFGRFGRVLGQILSDDFHVFAYDPNVSSSQYGVQLKNQVSVLACKTIFISVPIRNFKGAIQEIAENIGKKTTVIDVCSVKVYPTEVMLEILPENVDIIATHPLFGPDSITRPDGLKMMLHSVRNQHGKYEFWKEYFSNKSIKMLEMTPREHDRLAADSQGITHFIGRTMKHGGFESTPIDTLGFQDLLDVVNQTCYDSWELFQDLQNYNPFTMEMITKLEKSIKEIREAITRRNL